MRAENGTRYWAVPGREGFTHILGGLEKDNQTGAISTNPENHDLMTRLRQQKIANIQVPDLEVEGDIQDADLLIVGFGSTYGHLRAAMDELRQKGYKVAQTHFKYLNPLPKNTAEVHEGRQLRSCTVQSGKGSAIRGRRVSQRIRGHYKEVIL